MRDSSEKSSPRRIEGMEEREDLKEVKPIYCPLFEDIVYVDAKVFQKLQRIRKHRVILVADGGAVEVETGYFKELQSLLCSFCECNTFPSPKCRILEKIAMTSRLIDPADRVMQKRNRGEVHERR